MARPSAAVSSVLFISCVLVGAAVGGLMQMHGPNPVALGASIGIGVVVGALLAASVKVVAQWERMLILRLGKYHVTAQPGMRLIIPIFDTPMFVEMRVQTVPIAQQQAITQDNVPVVVN